MSNSGYRGRNFGPRGARTNGPANGFNGPRFPHPNFNHPRPPHRLPGPEKWIERPNYAPWQQNKNFHPHVQFRGNLQFRPNSRGRAVGGRGIIRFSSPGRPPAPQFCMGFIRNPVPRVVTQITQEEEKRVEENKAPLLPHPPPLGSEEERQQKISETADKLKQKLSSITEEELTNFWEDDLSVLPNNSSEEQNTKNKSIPELRHEPPELDLTFTDLRDIGRVDCNNSKCKSVDSKSSDEIQISFEQKPTEDTISTNDEITIIEENKEEPVIILEQLHHKEETDHSDILLEDDKCPEQTDHELSVLECNTENIQLEGNSITEGLNLNDVERKSLTSNLNQNSADVIITESVSDSCAEKSLDANNLELTSVSAVTTNDQDKLQVDFSQNQNDVQIDTQNTNRDTSEDSNVNVQGDSAPVTYSHYNEVHKASDDKKLNSPITFQPRVFNVPPRFAPRVGGLRCRWTFQQNGKNLFFRGPQRPPFHGNRISAPRQVGIFNSTDLVPAGFDPRAPPPFPHNVPVSSHDSQHNTASVPFSANDLPLAFDPSEPPPNIRPKSGTELSNMQENVQSIPSLDSRNQAVNIVQNNLKVIQPPPVFDPRGPPPRMPKVSVATSEKILGFNPQQPPPKIHKREENLQPPPIFDPRLSSQERSNLIAPLDTSRTSIMPMNLMETSPVADFNIGPVTSNFPQLPPMNIPSHQPFISNVQMNFQPVLSQTSSGQGIIAEYPLLPPPLSIAKVPLPPLKESPVKGNTNLNQSMDDGLEDMQEAMEFAKQIMNMTKETKNENASSEFSELPLTPSEIPIPSETVPPLEIGHVKKQKKKENKNTKEKQNTVCGPELMPEGQEGIEVIDEGQAAQSQSRNIEETRLSNDQIRPKVVFNLNSKTKKIHKPEEWHKIPVSVPESRETVLPCRTPNSDKQSPDKQKKEALSRKYSIEDKRKSSMGQKRNDQKDPSSSAKKNSAPNVSITNTFSHEKSNDASYHQKNYSRESKKLPAAPRIAVSNNTNSQKNSKRETRKENILDSESSWKNRVISRFLKMSKNDICNMVNNSSLRKFDIAMKHLVKERRSSLSQEMRNTEDEKMKEYDREEFMNQLNAMLDPSAVVGITDLPTEFIHHLSEVLQLDPMPFDLELSENQNTNSDEITTTSHNEISRMRASENSNKEDLRVQSFSERSEPQTAAQTTKQTDQAENQFSYNKEEVAHYSLKPELNLNVLREDTNSSHRSLTHKSSSEVESGHSKKQQPLFNEADLDDILSEVTERTKNLPNINAGLESMDKPTETRVDSSLMETATEAFGYNTFSQIPNKTAADLDDIFSAGIARVKLFGKSNADSGGSRIRKSSSEDRSTFRSERYERWSRKEREDPDTFRNLTKEEWEAKYGLSNAMSASITGRKSVSSSIENLSKDSRSNQTQRYCSSDSPTRNISVSPLTSASELSAHNLDRSYLHEAESRREQSESSSDTGTSTSSSSESDEETVSPNVTKLLKVIKEKEKIGKKKSINETIRDEVAAEIEKQWKEKSKHKERKSRKREKRKKDKKEKRRKEKRKRRRRNSYSDSSKSFEQVEGFRLLTEDEIKKEVIVKEEPVSSVEENTSCNNRINNICVDSASNKTTDSQGLVESQSSQIEKEQVPVAAVCDTVSSQIKNKSVIVPMQPKTKAQLKQMPESTHVEQKQIMEKAVEATKNTLNATNEKMRDTSQTNKDNNKETAKDNNERTGTASPASISSQEANVPLDIREPFPFVQPHTESIRDNSTADKTSTTGNMLNPVTHDTPNLDVNSCNQCIDQKTFTGTFAGENKSGSTKKIDIKAYKERALQRRLKEQAMLKENPGNSVSLTQETLVVTINKPNELNVINKVNPVGPDTNKVQLKDPRLPRVKLATISSSEDPAEESQKKTNSQGEHQTTDVTQKSKESSIAVESRNSSEKNETRPMGSNLDILKESARYKERKEDGKLEEFSAKEKSKLVSEEKKLKKISTGVIDTKKFKHIRSEGSKELKLKKDKEKEVKKAKQASEKKRKDSKLITEKRIEKNSHKTNSQESLFVNTDITVQTIDAKASSHDTCSEDSTKLPITVPETCVNLESTRDSKIMQEQSNNFTVQQNDERSTDSVKRPTDIDKQVAGIDKKVADTDKKVTDTNKKTTNSEGIICNQEAMDEEVGLKHEDKENLTNSEDEKRDAKGVKENAIKFINTNTLEHLDKQEDRSKDTSPKSVSLNHSLSIFTEKCTESTVALVPDYASEESYSLSERIDIDIEKSGQTSNIKDLKDAGVHSSNSTVLTEMDSRVATRGADVSVEASNVKRTKDKLHEKLKNQSRSPDSPCSPFKGFMIDSIEGDICQVSELYNNENSKEIAKDASQWLDISVNDEPALETAEERNDGGEDFSKNMMRDNGIGPMSNLVDEQEDVTDKADDNSLNVINDVKIGAALDIERDDVLEKKDDAFNVLEEERALSIGDIDSRNTFDEDNEPFIVLDEYIDDGDARSIEKLSTLDLDLEDCIARDTDIFASKSLQEDENLTANIKSPSFIPVDFKDLSDVFDNDNINGKKDQTVLAPIDEKGESVLPEKNTVVSTEVVTSQEKITSAVVSSTSELNIESNLKLPNDIKSINSTGLELPVESTQSVISTTSKDIISQRSATPGLSVTEKRKDEEENYHSTDRPEINSLNYTESSNVENIILPKSNSATKITTELKKQKESSNDLSKEGVPVIFQIQTSDDKNDNVSKGNERSKDTTKTGQKDETEVLHKIINKPKMKHKKQKRDVSEKIVKEVIKSDVVKVKCPNTKEAIMARMIEIDVEIHKLMTEKMTLYQMLTNDTIPSDNNSQQNNVTHEEIQVEAPVLRPRTPSALMSQLIQNIETSPVTDQRAKVATEGSSTRNSSNDTMQPIKMKALLKQDYHAEKKGSCTSTCGSDDEEVTRGAGGGAKSVSRKRKRTRFEKVTKRSENKSDCNVSGKDTHAVTEKKQANDATRTSKKTLTRQVTVEQDSSQITVNETKLQEDSNKMPAQINDKDTAKSDTVEPSKYMEGEEIIESAEFQQPTEEIVQRKSKELTEDSCLKTNSEETAEILNERNADARLLEKAAEGRTSERSSIYSDDSTWDSLLQSSGIDEQKKPSTGLALLEETYKKEMARTRRIKAAVRKKKRKKLQNLLETVNVLTPDEEELPLSALYIKKLHQKKKLLNSLEQQTKPQMEDPQLWTNLDEVINAVAENRTGNLCMKPLEEQSGADIEGVISELPQLKENSTSKEDAKDKEEERTTIDSTSNTKENCIEVSTDAKISSENEVEVSDGFKENDPELLGKSQELPSNEHFQHDVEVSVSPKTSKDLSEAAWNESTNVENVENVEKSVQQTVQSDNEEMNQPTLIENTSLRFTETCLSNEQNDKNISNNEENSEDTGKKDTEKEESNLQEQIASIEKDIEEPTSSQSVMSVDTEKSHDNPDECNSDKSINNSTLEEAPDYVAEDTNEGKKESQVSSVSWQKEANNDVEELSCASQSEHHVSLKEYKSTHTEQLNKTSNEENNNQNCAPVSSFNENTEASKSDETINKKSNKRKRGSSKTPLRRSSRYAEEPTKRVKIEADTANTESEVQEKNLGMQFPSVSSTSLSPCEEVETIWVNRKRSRSTQKSSRKRNTPEVEVLYSSSESPKGIKRHKQQTVPEMMNCVVKVVDCKHTILNPYALQKCGISRVNTCVYSNPARVDPVASSIQSTSTKDSLIACTQKEISLQAELIQSQTPKPIRKAEDAMQVTGDQINFSKGRKMMKVPMNEKEEHAQADAEVMPVLIKEPVTVDITQNSEKPEIEIVEEKMIVTKNQQHSNPRTTLTVIDMKEDKELPRTQYTVHKGPILDIKVFENSFLAASEDGRIYRYNQASNGILNIYKGHKAAVTCLYVYNANCTDISKEWMFSGSLDGTLRCYNITTGMQVRDTADIGSPIQCMDEAWGIIFIGTKSGHVSRYHMKSGTIKGNSIQFSDKSVLALKATNEGPRRVLIVASRSQPITIRDAQNGLFLRTICGQKSHTVYSLMRDHNLIYCGTSSTSIPVFDFTNGDQTMQYDAGVGIVCMRLYKQLLFAGCYDGNIYVFDTKDHRLVCSIPGPGNMLLSMEVIDNKIIAGSKDKRLQSWQMPRQVRSLL